MAVLRIQGLEFFGALLGSLKFLQLVLAAAHSVETKDSHNQLTWRLPRNLNAANYKFAEI